MLDPGCLLNSGAIQNFAIFSLGIVSVKDDFYCLDGDFTFTGRGGSNVQKKACLKREMTHDAPGLHRFGTSKTVADNDLISYNPDDIRLAPISSISDVAFHAVSGDIRNWKVNQLGIVSAKNDCKLPKHFPGKGTPNKGTMTACRVACIRNAKNGRYVFGDLDVLQGDQLVSELNGVKATGPFVLSGFSEEVAFLRQQCEGKFRIDLRDAFKKWSLICICRNADKDASLYSVSQVLSPQRFLFPCPDSVCLVPGLSGAFPDLVKFLKRISTNSNCFPAGIHMLEIFFPGLSAVGDTRLRQIAALQYFTSFGCWIVSLKKFIDSSLKVTIEKVIVCAVLSSLRIVFPFCDAKYVRLDASNLLYLIVMCVTAIGRSHSITGSCFYVKYSESVDEQTKLVRSVYSIIDNMRLGDNGDVVFSISGLFDGNRLPGDDQNRHIGIHLNKVWAYMTINGYVNPFYACGVPAVHAAMFDDRFVGPADDGKFNAFHTLFNKTMETYINNLQAAGSKLNEIDDVFDPSSIPFPLASFEATGVKRHVVGPEHDGTLFNWIPAIEEVTEDAAGGELDPRGTDCANFLRSLMAGSTPADPPGGALDVLADAAIAGDPTPVDPPGGALDVLADAAIAGDPTPADPLGDSSSVLGKRKMEAPADGESKKQAAGAAAGGSPGMSRARLHAMFAARLACACAGLVHNVVDFVGDESLRRDCDALIVRAGCNAIDAGLLDKPDPLAKYLSGSDDDTPAAGAGPEDSTMGDAGGASTTP